MVQNISEKLTKRNRSVRCMVLGSISMLQCLIYLAIFICLISISKGPVVDYPWYALLWFLGFSLCLSVLHFFVGVLLFRSVLWVPRLYAFTLLVTTVQQFAISFFWPITMLNLFQYLVFQCIMAAYVFSPLTKASLQGKSFSDVKNTMKYKYHRRLAILFCVLLAYFVAGKHAPISWIVRLSDTKNAVIFGKFIVFSLVFAQIPRLVTFVINVLFNRVRIMSKQPTKPESLLLMWCVFIVMVLCALV